MVSCWERADLLALVGDVYCIFITFPCGILGQVWYLIVSFPDLCRLSHFYNLQAKVISRHQKSKTKCYKSDINLLFLCIFPSLLSLMHISYDLV